MKSNHLTDEILQAYLLKEIEDDAIAKHLAECSICRAKLENYQYLVNNIQKIEYKTFSFNVTTVVMAKIVQYERQTNRNKELVFWGLLTFTFILIASLAIPFIPKILTLFYPKSIFTTLLLIVTGLVVFLFLLADINQQYKMKEEKIFKNNLQPIL